MDSPVQERLLEGGRATESGKKWYLEIPILLLWNVIEDDPLYDDATQVPPVSGSLQLLSAHDNPTWAPCQREALVRVVRPPSAWKEQPPRGLRNVRSELFSFGGDEGTTVQYSDGFKARMIKRIVGPERISANALSKEIGISQPTLSRWVRERRLDGMDDQTPPAHKRKRTLTPADKLRLVQESSQLAGDELGMFLRREGIHEAQLEEWTAAVTAAALASLEPKKRSRSSRSPEEKKIQALEKELNRKDRALAEVTAILALKKRVQEIWGDGDDDTDTSSGT
ncbi:MAG: transposase [Planctomycetota bacterium]